MRVGYKSMLFRRWTGIRRSPYGGVIMSTEGQAPQSRPVLQVGPLKPSLVQTLQDDYAAHVLPDEPAEFLAAHGEEIRAIVTSGRTGVDAGLMAALPNLGAVVNFGVGYDTTNVDAASARGVLVSNTPDVLTDCVADTAVGLVIDVMRQFSAADRYVRAGRWPVEGNYPLTRQVSNTRVGIIGLGRIGSAIALRLSAFGCMIAYHNRREVEGSQYTYVGSPVELAREVDVLIVAARACGGWAAGGGRGVEGWGAAAGVGAGGGGLVRREVSEAQGGEGALVNIARGSGADEAAWVEVLAEGPLAGAALDVLADEP